MAHSSEGVVVVIITTSLLGDEETNLGVQKPTLPVWNGLAIV